MSRTPGCWISASPCPGAPPSRVARPDRLVGVRSQAAQSGALCWTLRRLPRCYSVGVQDLPRAVQQQPLLGFDPRDRCPVEVRAYAEPVELCQDGQLVWEHPRHFN